MRDSTTTAPSPLACEGGTPVAAEPIPIVNVELDERDIERAVEVMRSGRLAQGPNVAALEKRFAEMSGADFAAACANGTCALQLAYGALVEPGDDVLVPGWTYIATATMIAARGATPIFCEVDPETYNLDVADAERRITPRTTAIAATHLYGNPADVEAIDDLARRRGLKVVYDAAQAHLATVNGKGLGAFGDAVTYSFYPTKNMTTGEGGMVTTRDQPIDRMVRLLRSHGETSKYTHEIVGFNYRMSDVEAAVGLSQLERLEERTRRRREIASRLDAAINEIEGLHAPAPTPGAEHVYHLYVVRMDPEAFMCPRDAFIEALRAEGVQTAVHYPKPVTRQPVFAGAAPDPLPICDRLAATLFCVPVHPALSDEQVRLIGEALAKVASAKRAQA